MSAGAISGVGSIALNQLAGAQGLSVNDLVSKTQNARLSSGLNISQIITQQRQSITNATVDQLLTPEKREKLKTLQGKFDTNTGTITNKKKFLTLAEQIEAEARQNLNAGKAGAFGGSRFLSSNPNALAVDGTQDAVTGTTAQVNVLQLATSTQEAIITIDGKEFRSKTNTFGADVTGLKATVIDAKQVTRTIETRQIVDLNDIGAIEKFDKKDNEITLSKAANAAIDKGEAVEIQFSKGLAGLSSSQTFFISRTDKKGKDAREFQVFATKQDALAGTNALDLKDVFSGEIDAARDAVKSIRSELNKLRPGQDDLVGGFGQAQKGLADIKKNLEALRPTFDGDLKDLGKAIEELDTASQQLTDATGRINGRKDANAAFGDITAQVEDFNRRLKNGEDLNPDKVISSLRPGIDRLSKEFGNVPEGQAKEVKKALNEVIEQFGDLSDVDSDGGDDKGDDKGGDKVDKKFRSALASLGNKLETLGNRFQTESNQVGNKAINNVSESLTDECLILRRIANDRNQDGNNINVGSVNLSTVTRTTKTITTDNTVTVQVLQDSETARKSIESLVSKVTEAVNLVQNDEELKKDVNFRKAASLLRRSLHEIVGASNGGLNGSSTSDVLTVDSEQLSKALTDEPTFRRIESALQRRGGPKTTLWNRLDTPEAGAVLSQVFPRRADYIS